MDKLFGIETVLLKIIEVGFVNICIIHVQIIHPWGGGSPRWLLFNFKTVLLMFFSEKELKSMTLIPLNLEHSSKAESKLFLYFPPPP